jgi:hypothetical protein
MVGMFVCLCLASQNPFEQEFCSRQIGLRYEAVFNERKKFRDASRRERLQAGKGSSFNDDDYTGDLTPMLRPMMQVNLSRLKQGQTFPDRDIIALRVADEAEDVLSWSRVVLGICYQL